MKLRPLSLLTILVLAPLPIWAASPGVQSLEATGRSDRSEFEQWIGGLTGEQRRGADFWTQERSKPRPASCTSASSNAEFLANCQEAQRRLAWPDVRRRTEAEYRSGWNASLATTNTEKPDNAASNGSTINLQAAPSSASQDLRSLQQRAVDQQSTKETRDSAARQRNTKLEEKLIDYVSNSVVSLEREGIQFRPVDRAFSYIALTSRSAGLGSAKLEKKDQFGKVGVVSVLFSSYPIVAAAGKEDIPIEFKGKMDWDGGSSQCKFVVSLFNGAISQSYDCNAFIDGRSSASFATTVKSAVRYVLTPWSVR